MALLRVDGEAIAAQVLMYCGATAYTWKTAFNATFAKYSPGALLIDKITEELFSRPDITGDQFLRGGSKLHGPALGRAPRHGRHAGRCRFRNSFGYQLEAARQLGYQRLRNWRDRVRHRPSAPVGMKLGKKLGTVASQ